MLFTRCGLFRQQKMGCPRNDTDMSSTETPAGSAGTFAPVALVFLIGLVVGVLANLLIPLPVLRGIWVQILGVVPLVAGILLFAWVRGAIFKTGSEKSTVVTSPRCAVGYRRHGSEGCESEKRVPLIVPCKTA